MFQGEADIQKAREIKECEEEFLLATAGSHIINRKRKDIEAFMGMLIGLVDTKSATNQEFEGWRYGDEMVHHDRTPYKWAVSGRKKGVLHIRLVKHCDEDRSSVNILSVSAKDGFRLKFQHVAEVYDNLPKLLWLMKDLYPLLRYEMRPFIEAGRSVT